MYSSHIVALSRVFRTAITHSVVICRMTITMHYSTKARCDELWKSWHGCMARMRLPEQWFLHLLTLYPLHLVEVDTRQDGWGCQNHACKVAGRIGLAGSIITVFCFSWIEEAVITLRDIDVEVIMSISFQLIFFSAEKLPPLENSWYVIMIIRSWLWLIVESFLLLLPWLLSLSGCAIPSLYEDTDNCRLL